MTPKTANLCNNRYHYEFFGLVAALRGGTAQAQKQIAGDDSSPVFYVVFERSGVTIAWEPGIDSILELTEAHGLRPDYSCHSGPCHTCIGKLVAGQVEYLVEPTDLPDPGCVLICCSKPRSDVIVAL